MGDDKTVHGAVREDRFTDEPTGFDDRPEDRSADEPTGFDNPPGAERDGRLVEEPTGFDHPPTERIPAQGDLSDGQTGADRFGIDEEQPADRLDESPDASVEPVESAPTIDSTELAVEPVTGSGERDTTAETPAGFFDGSAVTRFRERWRELQADFVDDPSRAVRGADDLVDEIIRELAQRKQGLDEHWHDGSDDTEELRVAMREYRSFLDQLLNA